MELRIRSLETKQTHRIEVPDPCSFHHLKLIISQTLNNPQIPSDDDEEDSLQSLGITSGDLIFFTHNPPKNPQSTLSPSSDLQSDAKPSSVDTLIAPEPSFDLQSEDTQKEGVIGEEEKLIDGEDFMEVDWKGDVIKPFTVPGFLRDVFTEELGNDGGRDHELLVVAIHAVLLESGLVLFDPVSKTEIKGPWFRNNWPAKGLFTLSLHYTLPEMIASDRESEPIPTAVLKFQCLSKYMTVYGSVSGPESVVHSVRFDENKLVPLLNVAWANEKQVSEFWRNVKDGLALPLLIELYEKSGSVLRCSFMGLPNDLKMNILELLPGTELAKTSVCRELRCLLSGDDLWGKKYVEQFGDVPAIVFEGEHWKQKFANRWKIQQKQKQRIQQSWKLHHIYALPLAKWRRC